DSAINHQTGRLMPGQYVDISDDSVRVAMRVPVEDPIYGNTYVMRASHPRFPNKWATSTLVRENGAWVTGAGFRLIFTQIDLSGLTQPDVIPPTISFASTPIEPNPGTNDAPDVGATITVTAIDDRAIQDLTVPQSGSVLLV